MIDEIEAQTTGPLNEVADIQPPKKRPLAELISIEKVPLTPEEEEIAAAIQADNSAPL